MNDLPAMTLTNMREKILRMKKTGSPVDFRCWRAGSVDLLPGGGSEEPGVSLPPMRASQVGTKEG